MRKSIIALSLLGAVLGLASVSAEAAPRGGPAKFYDRNGGFRGYAWCLKVGIEIFDCNYFNKAQCDMSASGRRAYCTPNPFGVEQGVLSYGSTFDAPPATRKVRRQVY
jgi:Protein of unknown function (DUF3551)